MINGYFVMDMQHHFIPGEALRYLGKTPEHDFTHGLQKYRRAYEVMANVDMHLEYMDLAGIDVAILSTGAFSPNGYEFCRVCNDGYSKVIKEHPEKFKGMVQIYPLDGKRCADEIKRGIEELGLWGLALATSYGNTTIDSSIMDDLWETAIRYGMPVYIHPTVRINVWGGERYNLYTTMAREYDISKSFVEILFGVLPRYPELRVIMSHFGGGLSALKGRLLAWHQPDGFVVPEEDKNRGLSIHQAKELGLFDDFEYRSRNFLFDSAGFGGWLPVIKSSFETLGPDHICFGSDFPYELAKGPYARRVVEDVSKLDFPDGDKRKFFEGNLKRVFSK